MSGVIATIPKYQFSAADGTPLASGTLTTYLAGTTTLSNTWQDSALTSANTNPITLDSRGECLLWLNGTLSYKLVLKNSAGVTQWTVDNVQGVQRDLANVTGTLAIANGGTGATTVAAARAAFGLGTADSPTFAGLTSSGAVSGTTGTFSGAVSGTTGTFSGNVQITSLNGGAVSLRNKIINGGMQVAQRGTATLTAAYQFGSCDRWQFICSGGTGISGTIYQNTITSYSTGYAGGVSAASWTTGQFFAQQRIEAKNVQDLNSKTVTVSCKVYQDTGGTRSWSISLVKPTALDNWTSQTSIGSVVAGSSTTGAVATISASFTLGATDASNGLGVLIFDNVANTVVSKIYLVGEVQLEVGPVATPFEQISYGLSLALCQRYFYAYTCGTSGAGDFGIGYLRSTTSFVTSIKMPVPLRVAPTAITFSGAVGDYTYQAGGTTCAVNGISAVAYGTDSCSVEFTSATASTIGFGGRVYGSAGARTLSFSGSEL